MDRKVGKASRRAPGTRRDACLGENTGADAENLHCIRLLGQRGQGQAAWVGKSCWLVWARCTGAKNYGLAMWTEKLGEHPTRRQAVWIEKLGEHPATLEWSSCSGWPTQLKAITLACSNCFGCPIQLKAITLACSNCFGCPIQLKAITKVLVI